MLKIARNVNKREMLKSRILTKKNLEYQKRIAFNGKRRSVLSVKNKIKRII